MLKLDVGGTIGEYRLVAYLGRGGFAHVYVAEHAKTGERVALKLGDVAGGGRYVTRFMEVTGKRSPEAISPDEAPAEAVFVHSGGIRIDFLDLTEIDNLIRSEGAVLEKISSPHVVGLREIIEHEGRPVLVMDYVRGKTLREKIRALEGIRLNWFLSLVKTLERLRAKDILSCHGDLKPENILVKPSGTVVMIDPARHLKDVGLISTTPHYNPLLLTTSKADVMSIGIMLYEILTGTLPFEDVPWKYAGTSTGGETVRMSLSYFLSYVPPKDLNPNTPDDLQDMIYRCLVVPDYDLQGLREDLTRFLHR
ncbi:MAG: protein kinase [Planctomycetes bacterium]|nr:protein kinase [Planctomycetota bacterium]MCB9891933.1 protein kinase [Planctomycetota bacterium]